MNNFKINHKRKGLDFEIAFTKAYKEAKSQYSHRAQIELSVLRAQYPHILHNVQDEDLFVGRIQFGEVGFGIQHQTGGFGFYIHEEAVVNELENSEGSLKYREDLHDMLIFWRSECSDARVLDSMAPDLKKALPSDDWSGESLPAVPILRIAGTYLNFDELVKHGIPGLEEKIRTQLKQAKRTDGDVILYECMLGALELLKSVCDHYIEVLRKNMNSESLVARVNEYEKMIEVLENIKINKPKSMREAIQLVWLYGLLTPEIEYGRVDIYLGDLYVYDIEQGIITEDEALAYMQSFFRLIDHLDCETDGRVIVGGYGRRNSENADRFCMVAIEACRTVVEVLPQFTLRFNKETPIEVWDASIRCIEEGRTYPLLYNDDVLIPGIIKAFGVDRQRAESYVPLGCGEIEFDHYSFGTPSGSLNMLKILELTIRGGFDPVSRKHVGPQVKSLVACDTFEDFLAEYKILVDYYVDAQAKFEAHQYKQVGKLHSFMFVSMLYDGCIESGKTIFDGGCASLNGTLEVYGFINAADSLASIKKLVFDEQQLTAAAVVQCLDDNFFGHEFERKMMLDAPKYGNDDDYVDDITAKLHQYLCKQISDRAPEVGLDSNLAVFINNAQNTTLSRWVGATPDGRKAGTSTANANNPSPGQDKNGITAMINSLLKLPHDNHAGMVQNFRFSRELFENSRDDVVGLIEGYFNRGGGHAMITVIGKDVLNKAIEKPEDYQNLIVRVGGFSARFINLPKDVQKEIYERVTY